MKHLLLTLVLCSAAFVGQARAGLTPPYFGGLRVEVTNQLAIASNAPTLDRKLITALRRALTLIDKANPTNLVSDTKTLTTLTTTLNKSSLSNLFDAELQTVVDIYRNVLLSNELSLSNRLAATFPSGPHTAAQNNLNQMLAALVTAGSSLDSGAAARALSLAAKKGVVAAKLTTKAENAPPPGNVVAAKVNGANFRSAARTTEATYEPAINRVQFTGVAGTKALTVFIITTPGTSTHFFTTSAIYSSGTQGQAVSSSGTITITLDTARKVISGTFSFEADSFSPLLGHVSVTDGTFFATYE